MKNKSSLKSDINLVNLIERFGSDEKCRAYLTELRWPHGVQCPRCKWKGVSEIAERGQYDCNVCRYQFSVTSNTIFHDTHLPIWKWFLAIYLMIEARKGISANQVMRTIKTTYKTAWFLCHRIRAAMREVTAEKLNGIVEIDETFIGGKAKGKENRWKNKIAVIGAVQRGGEIRLRVVPYSNRFQFRKFVDEAVDPTTEAIYTDDNVNYVGIEDSDTRHETVNHSAEQWVCGDVHTNSVEGVWSLFKRSVIGTYHKLSAKHLDAYLDELEHRFNKLNNEFLFRDTLLKLVKAEKLPYAQLTKAA
jgi:transposase-like protein